MSWLAFGQILCGPGIGRQSHFLLAVNSAVNRFVSAVILLLSQNETDPSRHELYGEITSPPPRLGPKDIV
jgi:hypothetical protein